MQSMIQLQGISKTYMHRKKTLQALYPIDLSVQKGEIFGIIGLSGAGKSTLLRMVNLLELPTSGRVYIDGQELNAQNTAQLRGTRQQIGMIFQHFNLLNSQTVFENIALPLKFAHWSCDKIQARVEELLELIGLTDKRNAYPGQLSGGQKQRVAIARALALSPKILLCDEATSALDPHTTQNILQLLQEINKKLNLTILLITHEMDVIKHICHHVAVLDHGHLVEQSSVIDLFIHPQHDVTKRFVESYMGLTLPEDVQLKLQNNADGQALPLLKLAFRGESALRPLIAELMTHCETGVNILLANMQVIQQETMGVTILMLQNPNAEQSALTFLQNLGVRVEVLGYVNTVY
ncbi:MAG: methionine ABC transporter ATP-binding protein [Legionellales bacterium]